MDNRRLIERLRDYSRQFTSPQLIEDMLAAAELLEKDGANADPIPPTIKPGDIIADLLFAFINQDADCPHDFEIQAVEKAVEYLRNHHQPEKYGPQLFESHLKRMLEVSHD